MSEGDLDLSEDARKSGLHDENIASELNEPVAAINDTLLRELIEHKGVDDLLTCLHSEASLCLTYRSSWGDTLLHIIATSFYLSPPDAAAILAAVVHHAERHPKDIIHWEEENGEGETFISLAAAHQRLSLLYPLVRHMPYFGDRLQPIVLDKVWKWDYESLDPDDQNAFDISKASHVWQANRATGQLWTLSFEKEPDVDAIRTAVRNGADVMFSTEGVVCPILFQFCWRCSPLCIRACLDSLPRPPLPLHLDGPVWNLPTLEEMLHDNVNISEEERLDILDIIAHRSALGADNAVS